MSKSTTFHKEPIMPKIFEISSPDNPTFWSRLGGKPSFEGLTIMDVGCGTGSLCFDIANSGAKKVVGLDTGKKDILKANKYLEEVPQFHNIIEFVDKDLSNYDDIQFDYIVSRNAIEHIVPLKKLLKEMKKRLKPKGKIIVSSGSLWNSPLGYHNEIKNLFPFKLYIPWAHLILGDKWIINKTNRLYGKDVKSIHDLGLNQKSFEEYKQIFNQTGLKIIYYKINESNHPAVKLFSLLRKIPFLEEYFTVSIYCIMEKQSMR